MKKWQFGFIMLAALVTVILMLASLATAGNSDGGGWGASSISTLTQLVVGMNESDSGCGGGGWVPIPNCPPK